MKELKTVLDKRREKSLQALCLSLGLKFNDISLLDQALTHTSYANECKQQHIGHNERLEFLGDAVLDLIISEYLFRSFPYLPEGELTKARANTVCEQTLSQRALELGIGEYLLLGKGESLSGGRKRISILADAFEAVIGAVYIDSNYTNTLQFVLQQLQQALSLVEKGDYINDYKTLLQESVQKHNDAVACYKVVEESGPDHDKVFKVAVLINQESLGIGQGKSKKEAEQHAAKQALIKMNVISE
jgi:ribonuclease-3